MSLIARIRWEQTYFGQLEKILTANGLLSNSLSPLVVSFVLRSSLRRFLIAMKVYTNTLKSIGSMFLILTVSPIYLAISTNQHAVSI